ncbi:hypothetical protein IAU59_001645 [Kwoniella sp. CBS 9459]
MSWAVSPPGERERSRPVSPQEHHRLVLQNTSNRDLRSNGLEESVGTETLEWNPKSYIPDFKPPGRPLDAELVPAQSTMYLPSHHLSARDSYASLGGYPRKDDFHLAQSLAAVSNLSLDEVTRLTNRNASPIVGPDEWYARRRRARESPIGSTSQTPTSEEGGFPNFDTTGLSTAGDPGAGTSFSDKALNYDRKHPKLTFDRNSNQFVSVDNLPIERWKDERDKERSKQTKEDYFDHLGRKIAQWDSQSRSSSSVPILISNPAPNHGNRSIRRVPSFRGKHPGLAQGTIGRLSPTDSVRSDSSGNVTRDLSVTDTRLHEPQSPSDGGSSKEGSTSHVPWEPPSLTTRRYGNGNDLHSRRSYATAARTVDPTSDLQSRYEQTDEGRFNRENKRPSLPPGPDSDKLLMQFLKRSELFINQGRTREGQAEANPHRFLPPQLSILPVPGGPPSTPQSPAGAAQILRSSLASISRLPSFTDLRGTRNSEALGPRSRRIPAWQSSIGRTLSRKPSRTSGTISVYSPQASYAGSRSSFFDRPNSRRLSTGSMVFSKEEARQLESGLSSSRPPRVIEMQTSAAPRDAPEHRSTTLSSPPSERPRRVTVGFDVSEVPLLQPAPNPRQYGAARWSIQQASGLHQSSDDVDEYMGRSVGTTTSMTSTTSGQPPPSTGGRSTRGFGVKE